MSVEDKLKEILSKKIVYASDDKNLYFSIDDLPAQIIELFKDEGWTSELIKKSTVKGLEHIRDGHYLSGQQWYDRFQKKLELENLTLAEDYENALKVARRISGL